MRFPKEFYQMAQQIAQRFPDLRRAQQFGLALWVYGAIEANSACQNAVVTALSAYGGDRDNLRQRLRELLYDGKDRAAPCRTQIDVRLCFAPLMSWILSTWRGDTLCLALDPTLEGDRITALVISLLYRGTAVPIAWKILPANQPGLWMPPYLELLQTLKRAIPPEKTVFVLADRGLWSRTLWKQIQALGWHPQMRVQKSIVFQPLGGKKGPASRLVSAPGQVWIGKGWAFKEHRMEVTLIAVWKEGKTEPCLTLTDVPVEKAPATMYGLRFWIEMGFRTLKSFGWRWDHSRRSDPARVERHWLVMALAQLFVVLAGTRDEDAELVGSSPERLRKPPLLHRPIVRRSSIFRRGLASLKRQFHRGRLLAGSWLTPEPLPNLSSQITLHIHSPT